MGRPGSGAASGFLSRLSQRMGEHNSHRGLQPLQSRFSLCSFTMEPPASRNSLGSWCNVVGCPQGIPVINNAV